MQSIKPTSSLVNTLCDVVCWETVAFIDELFVFKKDNAIVHKAWNPNQTKHQLNRFLYTWDAHDHCKVQYDPLYACGGRFVRSWILKNHFQQNFQKMQNSQMIFLSYKKKQYHKVSSRNSSKIDPQMVLGGYVITKDGPRPVGAG